MVQSVHGRRSLGKVSAAALFTHVSVAHGPGLLTRIHSRFPIFSGVPLITGLKRQTFSAVSSHRNPPVDTILPPGANSMARRSGSGEGGGGGGGAGLGFGTAVATTFASREGVSFFFCENGAGWTIAVTDKYWLLLE